jgi:ubiquinone biosynthesis protein
MSRLLLQLFDVTHMFGMHLRPELVLLQKTMVQVEGVSRALDPQHDMWAAARPIVERWVKRELGAEAVARRAVDEAGLGLAALRRLPQTMALIESAARKVSTEAPRQERQWYEMPVFWIGLIGGALIMFVFGPRTLVREPAQPIREPARIERQIAPAPRANGPAATAPIPPAVEQAQDALEESAPEEPEEQKAATP